MGEKKTYLVFLSIITACFILLAGCMIVDKAELDQKRLTLPQESSTIQKNKEILPQPSASAEEKSCDDSIDGGNNPSVPGVTVAASNQKVTRFTDTCTSEDYLTEYYCDGTEYKSYSKLCARGCREGMCLQQPESLQPARQLEPSPRADEAPSPASIPECFNGYRDLQETASDCGGPQCKPCGYGKACKIKRDCAAPLACNQRNFLCLDKAYT